MMYGDYSDQGSRGKDRNHDSNFNCIKYLIYTTCVVVFLCLLAMVGGSIFILITKSYISAITGNELFVASVWLVIVGGSLAIFSIPICGCVGAIMEKRKVLIVFIGFLILLFLTFLAGGICAIVLRGEIGEWIMVKMEEHLKDEYGVNLQDPTNRFITQEWDKAQKDMYCCGVREQSWAVYRVSNWYAEQPNLYGDQYGGNIGKPLVPESCCVLDRNDQAENIEKCQFFLEGPPFRKSGDAGSNQYNNALHYRGCYEAAKQWIKEYTGWIIGFGMGFAAAMIIAIISTVLLVLRL